MFQRIWYGLGRALVSLFALIALKMNVLWKARRPDGPVILVANHPSTSDPAIITTLVSEPTSILIKDVLFKVPLFGRSLRMSGHIPVAVGGGQAALDEAEKMLRAGRSVVIFPEGEISPIEGGLHRPRTGAARLALRTGAPVIPVGIGLDPRCMQILETKVEGKAELGTWYFHGPYAMTVGDPMYFRGSEEDRELVRRVSQQMINCIADLADESRARLNEAYPTYGMSLPIRVFNFGMRLLVRVA